MGLISRLTGKRSSSKKRSESKERDAHRVVSGSTHSADDDLSHDRSSSTDSSLSNHASSYSSSSSSYNYYYGNNNSTPKSPQKTTTNSSRGSWRQTNTRSAYFGHGTWGRQSSVSVIEFESPQGSQLTDMEWDGIGRSIVTILTTGSLGDAQIDVLEGAIAQLLRKASAHTICRHLVQTLQDHLAPHHRMLAESNPQDFLHKLHIRWQQYRSVMLPLLEGSFLAVQDALDRRQDENVLSIHDQCIVAYRNTVLLAETSIAAFQKAAQHQKEVVKEPLPAWFIQMALEIALIDTKDNRGALFRSTYLAAAEGRLQEVYDSKKKQDTDDLRKLYQQHGEPLPATITS